MADGALLGGGRPSEEVLDILKQRKTAATNIPWRGPRMFKPSYFAGDDVLEVAQQAFNVFISENWLYSRTSFPALGQIEDEVVASLRGLFHGPAQAGGVMTSGGTESLMLAVKIPAHRAEASARGNRRYNIVLPWSAHPALDKAADLMHLEVRRAPPSDGLIADVAWMEQACDEDTVLLVGSAPPYPYGVMDPLAELSALAERKGIWLHVDACLGGMILPFAPGAGWPADTWDFRLPGVRSISVDLHKFGWAAKGVSALMLRDKAEASHARTAFTNWPAGLYGTPGVAGTRSGGALASAWAVMRYLGHQGFVERVGQTFAIRDEFMRAIEGVGGRVLGKPQCYHFAFRVEGVDNLAVAEHLMRDGWHVGSLERPASVQLMINVGHAGMAQPFAEALAGIVEDLRSGKRAGSGKGSVYSM